MNFLRSRLAVFVLIVVIIVCGSIIYSHKTQSNTIKIGGLFMLTGPQATFGEIQKRSAELAVEEVNAGGGINRKKVKLIVEDTVSDPKKAVDGYYALKNKGVHIFDVEGSPMAASVRKLIIDGGDFVMTAGATTPTYYDNNVRSCRLTATAKSIGPILADYILKKGYKKISVLAPNNEYGKGIEDELSKALVAKGGSISISEFYNAAGPGDFRTNITKIKSTQGETDAIFAIDAANTVESMFKQLSDLGWNKPIISDYNTLSNPALKNLTLANNVEYIDWDYVPQKMGSDSTVTKSFKERFVAKTGQNPSLLDAAYYDSIATIIKALSAVGDNPQKMGEYISSLKDYQVVTGKVASFDNDCEATRHLIFRKIQDGKIVQVN